VRMITRKFPGAFTPAAPTDDSRLVPNSSLFFGLMVGYTKDGRYMQFSQVSEHLWQAYLDATGLREKMATTPGWKDAWQSEDEAMRVAFWEEALTRTRSKTYDEWLAVFDENPDVWAEIFRSGSELLHHPQIVHDGCAQTVIDPQAGPVLQ